MSAAAGLIGASSSISPSTVGGSRLRKGRGHRRQMSDPRVSSLMREREESPADVSLNLLQFYYLN